MPSDEKLGDPVRPRQNVQRLRRLPGHGAGEGFVARLPGAVADAREIETQDGEAGGGERPREEHVHPVGAHAVKHARIQDDHSLFARAGIGRGIGEDPHERLVLSEEERVLPHRDGLSSQEATAWITFWGTSARSTPSCVRQRGGESM